MLMNYRKFLLESRLRDVVFIKGNKEDFKFTTKFNDVNLINMIHIDKFNKNIFIKYYNTNKHNIEKKIESRTSLESIGEFNELLEKGLNRLFSYNFDFLYIGHNRYELIFPENKIYLIIDIDYDNLFKDYTEIYIVTIMSNQAKHNTINKSIIINDDDIF
jgi:hypothetical protein